MRFRLAAATGAALAVCSLFGMGCTTTISAGISPPAGCSTNSSLVCPGGGDGWTCSAGTNPEDVASGLSCSVPQPDGPNDDFCCIAWTTTSTTCSPDNSVTNGCAYPSYGYSCAAGDDPTSLDSSLNCSQPTPNGPNDEFCCQ